MKSRIILLITTIWLGCLSSAMAILQYPMTVTNIAELKSLNPASVASLEIYAVNNPTVYVLGYYTSGDRGGGMFEWDPNAADSDDGYWIKTNGWSVGNGRWVRRLGGDVPNIRMWGAMGNIALAGIASAHDDTTNIQNAINAVASPTINSTFGDYAELLIPSGSYKVTDTLILHDQIKLRGETVRKSWLVMPYGVNKDILHTVGAEQAISANDGQNHYDGVDRIEDITFEFGTENDGGPTDPGERGHNLTNAAIVICQPEEGSEIRNVNILTGGYGIRCLEGGGADMSFRDIACYNSAIAGICIEPVPGASSAGGQFSFTGISGDHRWDESRSNACLIKFVNYAGPAFIEGVNAEGVYGGGVIHHQFPAALAFYDLGNLTMKNCYLNSGLSYSGLDSSRSFVTLESAGLRTAAVTMENIHLFGATNLIQDLLSPRNVTAPDASSLALYQAVVRLPLEYEAYNDHGFQSDGATESKWSRLVVGGQVIYSFVPTTTNAWYRILQSIDAATFISTKATVSSFAESSEFSVNVYAVSDPNSVELNVTRTMKDNTYPYNPCVTKVRAGGYRDATGATFPFTDIYVQRSIPPLGIPDYNFYQITIACPVYDHPNLSADNGETYLLNPTTPLSSIVPPGCTLLQCVTNSLVR